MEFNFKLIVPLTYHDALIDSEEVKLSEKRGSTHQEVSEREPKFAARVDADIGSRRTRIV